MAHFSLADAVDPPKTLLYAVRIPGHVVVHHQVRALQVDPLTRGIGCEEHLDLWVVLEGLLRLGALFATHPSVNDDDCVPTAEDCGDILLEVAQCVTVFSEDHQLLPRRWDGRWN